MDEAIGRAASRSTARSRSSRARQTGIGESYRLRSSPPPEPTSSSPTSTKGAPSASAAELGRARPPRSTRVHLDVTYGRRRRASGSRHAVDAGGGPRRARQQRRLVPRGREHRRPKGRTGGSGRSPSTSRACSKIEARGGAHGHPGPGRCHRHHLVGGRDRFPVSGRGTTRPRVPCSSSRAASRSTSPPWGSG